jgi:hypothetical protein
VVETTLIPPEGEGPAGWIGEARRVEELYEQGLLTIKLALAEATKEGARGKSATIELGTSAADGAKMAASASHDQRPAAPSGAREWLAEMLRWSVADAQRAPRPDHPELAPGA